MVDQFWSVSAVRLYHTTQCKQRRHVPEGSAAPYHNHGRRALQELDACANNDCVDVGHVFERLPASKKGTIAFVLFDVETHLLFQRCQLFLSSDNFSCYSFQILYFLCQALNSVVLNLATLCKDVDV